METYFGGNFENRHAMFDSITNTTFNKIKVIGFESFSKSLYIQSILVPDNTMRLIETKLLFDSDSSLTIIKCKLQFYGTAIYESPEIFRNVFLTQTFPLTKDTNETNNLTTTSDDNNTSNKRKYDEVVSSSTHTLLDDRKVTYFINTVENLTKRTLKLLETPHSFVTDGEMTLYLDENNMVSVCVCVC
jgi:hypothetical protein